MDIKILEDLFYSKPYYLSYSALNLLLYAPKTYYNRYVLGNKMDFSSPALIDGKIIHCLLLDNGSFDEHFIIIPKTLPTGNTRTILDQVFTKYNVQKLISEVTEELFSTSNELSEHSNIILGLLKNINLHQSLKTDQQRLDKIITDESKSYWEFLKLKGDKELLDDETLTRCNAAVTALREDSNVCHLLGLLTNEMENVEVYNEKYLEAESEFISAYPFGFKGIVDNIKIDHDKKIIYINDLKTTGKTISDFKETIEFYSYYLQAAIYDRLVKYKFKDVINENWTVVFNFIVIDKYQQVYAFQVSAETMMEWQLRLEQKLKEAAWHYNKRNYRLPYQFASGQVIL